MVFDFGVNAGPRTSVKVLQRAVGVVDDGAIGPKTLAAVKAATGLNDALVSARLAHYRSLGNFAAFGNGWTNRTRQVADLARGMRAMTGLQPSGDRTDCGAFDHAPQFAHQHRAMESASYQDATTIPGVDCAACQVGLLEPVERPGDRRLRNIQLSGEATDSVITRIQVAFQEHAKRAQG
jgi:lysozyme family protein